MTGRLLSIARLILLPCVMILNACSGESGGKDVGVCAPIGENQIRDSSFETLSAHHSEAQWQASEHRAGGAFESGVTDGTLIIRKIGDEPWFLIAQSVQTEALVGATLSFSAELKLDLHEPEHPHGFGYGGGLSVFGKHGGKVVVNSTLEHEPHIGVHDWHPVEVIFKLPKNVNYLRVGFLHQAGGSMQVRNPGLYTVNPGCPLTAGKSK